MIHSMSRVLYSIYIKVLLVVKPAVLFKKINQLDWYQGTLHKWIEDQEFASKAKLLEVGCATGVLSEYLAESDYAVTGVDASKSMINAAISNKYLAEYHVADVSDLPFKDDVFDAVISASLINIVPDPLKAIAEMARVCKPGGCISILVPLQGFNNEKLQGLVDSLGIYGFSEAALNTWHNYAPKIDMKNVEIMYKDIGLNPTPAHDYLHGMIFSLAATKVF